MILGSEGRLGLISTATVHVHRLPAAAGDPRLPVPDLGGGARGDARHRGERGGAVGDARVRRRRRRSSRSPRASARRPSTSSSRRALMTFLQRRRGFDLDAMCLAFIGYEGSERHVKAQRRLVGRIIRPPRRPLHRERARARCTTRRSSTRRTSATSCSTAACSPTCPRPRRRGAGWRVVYDAATAAAHGAFAELGVPRLRDVPPVALLPLGRVPVLHVRAHPVGPARAARRVRDGQVRDPAVVRRLRRDAVAPPRGRDRARAVARAGHLRARAWRCCARCSTASTRAVTSIPRKIIGALATGRAGAGP